MSENIPESIPTSADSRSQRPVKRARGGATALSAQSAALEHLFAQPDKPVHIPESATRGPKSSSSLAAPPEIVANVQGSSAGAGSGEFHVYKASRRREFERIRLMEEEAKREELDKEWEEKQAELRRKEEAGKSKNAKRRARAKLMDQAKKDGTLDVQDRKENSKRGVTLPKRKQEDDEGGDVKEEGDMPLEPEAQGIIIHDDD